MYELNQLGEQSYYINCPAKIGIYRQNETDVYLIDSGNDKDAGRRVRKILDEQGWTLKGIINTHSNADHIGGNHYLQKQTGCKIFAAGIERAFTEFPILESSFLYGGFPLKDLRHKFLLAEGSECISIEDKDFPKELEIIPLPGHFFDMIGIKTPDGTAFIADCVSSPATLEKYKVSFIYAVEEYLSTLDKVEKLEAKIFVPAHAEVTNNMSELCKANRDCVNEIGSRLCNMCREKIGFEEILKRIFDGYGLSMNFEQYVLVGSTVRSYLSWLSDKGMIKPIFENNRLLWIKI